MEKAVYDGEVDADLTAAEPEFFDHERPWFRRVLGSKMVAEGRPDRRISARLVCLARSSLLPVADNQAMIGDLRGPNHRELEDRGSAVRHSGRAELDVR
jgi:hypothetical protein